MPFIDTCDSETTPEFYNVVNAVGRNCPNKQEDVKLLQLMLQLLYRMPLAELTVDGICGPLTKGWILKFQTDLRTSGISVTVDQRMDRVRDHRSSGSISHTRYSLLSLNELVQSADPTGWSSTPAFIALADPQSVPPPSNDNVDVPSPAVQKTSPNGGPRTRTSPAVQSSSPK